MPRYRVFLRGENLAIPVEGVLTELGFYTTRAVSAATPELAVWVAEQRVRDDLKRKLHEVPDGLTIHLEEVHPVAWWWRRFRPATGFTFYASNGDDASEGIYAADRPND